MKSSNGSMGMSKHRGHGIKNGAGKSPKMREHLKREAAKNDRKAPDPLPYKSVSDAFRK